MKKTLFSTVAVLAIAMFAATQPALAQKPLFANVSSNAQCTLLPGPDLLVDAGLIQKDAPSSDPYVSTVVFSLEQHFPNQSKWFAVSGSDVTQGVNDGFDLLPAGERYDVATNTYSPVCSQAISPFANAVRAVVKITVDNANTSRPGSNVFTGRCVSIPNPCK